MRAATTRRGLLSGLAGLSLAGRVGAARDGDPSDERPTQVEAAFDPATHGFGFRNWSTRGDVYADHDHDAVSRDRVRRALERRWEAPAKRRLGVDVMSVAGGALDAIAAQVYVSVNQQSATNGHCYGMVFAAQQFYENPDSVPLDRESASEFVHPDAPVGEPDTAPVARDVDRYHLTQFLDLRAWLGRRAMLHPNWIRYERQLDRLTAAVDEYGTAGITLFDGGTRTSHQVLVYDYRRDADATRLFVYDPNYPARRYASADSPPTVTVDTGGSKPVVRPYDGAYDEFVFNRRDRTIAAGNREAAPADPPTGGNAREELFSLAVFLVDSADVSLTVVGPDDRPLGRDAGAYADRTRSEYSRMRYRYGFKPGRYDIGVVAESATEYELRSLVADADGERLDARRSNELGAGEVHRYAATVPASGTGSLDRGYSWPSTVGAVGLGAGTAAVAAGTYARARRRTE